VDEERGVSHKRKEKIRTLSTDLPKTRKGRGEIKFQSRGQEIKEKGKVPIILKRGEGETPAKLDR